MEYEKEEYVKWGGRQKQDYSNETIRTYCQRLKQYFQAYEELNEENFTAYLEEKEEEDLSKNSLNIIKNAFRSYAAYLEHKYKEDFSWLKQPLSKVKKVQFLEDIISMPDYVYMLGKAKEKKRYMAWLSIKIIATTGVRLSELMQIKREHIEAGHVDIYGKGAKQRRIYFPKKAQQEILEVLDRRHIKGLIFEDCSKRGIQYSMEQLGKMCNLPKGMCHPHMFRHFFAKTFIQKYQNIALLADLLGHSNIETTRIYLKFTSREQKEIVDQVVEW